MVVDSLISPLIEGMAVGFFPGSYGSSSKQKKSSPKPQVKAANNNEIETLHKNNVDISSILNIIFRLRLPEVLEGKFAFLAEPVRRLNFRIADIFKSPESSESQKTKYYQPESKGR